MTKTQQSYSACQRVLTSSDSSRNVQAATQQATLLICPSTKICQFLHVMREPAGQAQDRRHTHKMMGREHKQQPKAESLIAGNPLDHLTPGLLYLSWESQLKSQNCQPLWEGTRTLGTFAKVWLSTIPWGLPWEMQKERHCSDSLPLQETAPESPKPCPLPCRHPQHWQE